jgi:putative ABC transport system permease protein
MRRLKHRKAPLLAIVAAVALGAALMTACAGLLQTALVLDAPPHRLAGADVVVTASEHAQLAKAKGTAASPVTLSERARIPAGLTEEIATVDGVARALAHGSLGAIAITARPGVDPGQLKSRLDDRLEGRHVSVLTGDDRGRAEETGVAASRLKLVLLAGIFGGMALVVMAILLQSIIGLSIEQRQREIALLRTIGATPRQVRRMVVGQTMRPALLAAAAGAFVGPVLGRALFDRVKDGGVVPDVLALRQGVIPMAVGGLAALLVARVSAGIGARRAGKVRLNEALGEVEGEPGKLGPVRVILAWVAVASAATSGVMTMFAPPENAAAIGGSVALAGAIGCAMIAPRLTELLAERLSGVAHRFAGVPGELAVLNVRARAHRTASLVVPVLLVVSVALANVYQTTTQAHGMRSAYLDSLRADAVVTSATGAVPHKALDIARSAGSASGLSTSDGWIEQPVDKSHRQDPWRVVGVEPSALATKVADGSLAGFRGSMVALPKGTANDLDVKVGDTIGMVLGDGAHVRVRVAALLGGSGRYASIVVPPALLAAHTTTGLPAQVLVNGDGDVRGKLADALARQPGLTVRGGSALADDFDDGLQVDQWITFAVVAVIIAYAAMSLANLLVAALGGRRRELALLRLAGATRRQIRRMLQAEALLVAAIGAIAGTAVALAGLIPLAIAQAGSPLPTGPVWFFPAVLVVVAALVLVPTLAMTHTTLRTQKVTDVESL